MGSLFMRLINVMAASLDGRIGVHDREGDLERQAVGMSSSEDQVRLRRHIEGSEAIIVGASSIRANRACLDHPGNKGVPPVWYIFAQNEIPDDFEFWRQKHIQRVIVSPRPLKIVDQSGVKNLVYGTVEPAAFLYRHLEERNISTALLFGGGIINSWFYTQGFVNQLELTLAPLMLGKDQAPFLVAPVLGHAVQFLLLSSQVSESFVFLSYSVVPIG